MRAWACIFIPLLLGIRCIAQPVEQLYFQHLTTEHKLSQTTNGFIFKDSRGFVWISSNAGLNRFDGKNIKIYLPVPGDTTSLFGQNIQSYFYEDPKGNIWFSTYEGINCYIRKTDSFEHFALKDAHGQAILGYHVCGLDRNGVLWVIVENKTLYHFPIEERAFHFYHPLFDGAQRGTYQYDPKGRISRFLAYSYDPILPGLQITYYQDSNNISQEYYFSDFLCYNLPPLRIWRFYEENDTTIWLATQIGLIEFNPVGKAWSNYDQFKGKKVSGFTSVRKYDDQYLVLSSSADGLLFFDRVTRKFSSQIIRKGNGIQELTKNSVSNVYVDDDKGLWLTINRVGVDYSTPLKIKFEAHLTQNPLDHAADPLSFSSIADAGNGTYWAGTHGNGIFVLDASKSLVGRITKGTHPELASNRIIQLLKGDSDHIWILTWDGLSIYDLQTGKIRQMTHNNQIFLSGISIGNGNIVLGPKSGGLYLAKKQDKDFVLSKIEHVPTSQVFVSLLKGKNQTVYGCDLNAILVFDVDGEIKQTGTLPIAGDVKCLFEAPGDSIIWFASQGGLARYNKQRKETRVFTVKDGLPNSSIHAIVPDDAGNLWLSTNGGIACFYPDFSCRSFGLPDGLSSLEFNPGSYLTTAQGKEAWFGSTNGLTTFYPEKIKSSLPLPKIQITGIEINQEKPPSFKHVRSDTINLGEIKHIDLNYFENTISLEFAALEYSSPQDNRFRYRIPELEDYWVEGGTEGFARYSNLKPGNYHFQILASNSDGEWIPESLSRTLKIKVHKPFWDTWIFRFGVFALLTFAVWRIYKYRVDQLLRLERLRNQISSDLHDDLGATLGNLQILSALIRKKLPADSQVIPLLARIEEEVLGSAESLDDIIWSINPKNDSLDRVFARMRRFASEVFEAKGIEGSIDFPQMVGNLRLDMGKRRQFYLLFKEAVHNLAKYSECTQATVKIDYHEGKLALLVQDNGIGFDLLKNLTKSNGMRTMQQRSDKLRGQLNIKSVIGTGTKITLSFPITEKRDSR